MYSNCSTTICQNSTYILGVKKMIIQLKISCPSCLRLNKKNVSAFKDAVPDLIKTIHPPFSYFQANIFGPIFAYVNLVPKKRWVLVNLCLTSRAFHLEMFHIYRVRAVFVANFKFLSLSHKKILKNKIEM